MSEKDDLFGYCLGCPLAEAHLFVATLETATEKQKDAAISKLRALGDKAIEEDCKGVDVVTTNGEDIMELCPLGGLKLLDKE